MKPEKARAELQRVFDLEEDLTARKIGTPELRAKFYQLDPWHERYPDFNPVKLIAVNDSGGYSWHFYAVFKNKNGSYAYVHGSGGSDAGPGSRCDIDFYGTIDSTIARLRKDSAVEYSGDAVTEVYRQTLMWVATKGQRTE
jgi:hypothetical protein